MKQYSCNNSHKLFNRYLPLIFILIATLAFSPIFSRLSSNIVIEGAANADADAEAGESVQITANADADANILYLHEIETANNSLTNIIEERNYIFPKYLDTDTTNARLDYTTLDVNSINMQLVLLSGVAIVIGIFIMIHLTQ